MQMADENREQLIDELKEKYEPRIIAVLKKIVDVCREAGMVPNEEPYDMHDETYRWYLVVWRREEDRKPYTKYGANEFGVDPDTDVPDYDKSIDISIEIAEAKVYGDDPKDGINFSLSIVENGGAIIGGVTPFNYTSQCWVPASDEEAVEERWLLIEGAEFANIPALCED